jgi:hypothetical protein
LCFQVYVFLTSSKHKNSHTGWQVPQSDYNNSLHVDKKDLFTLIQEIQWHTQHIVKECLVVPSQWSCYHPCSECQPSGTSGIMEYHEALRRIFISTNILSRTKEYTFPSWIWTQKVRLSQDCSSKWLWELTLLLHISDANWKRNMTCGREHTHTHQKWWYPNSYPVN